MAALVKKHDQSFIRNTADRFRFESLQNRHAKFIELWERQMTNRELGRTTSGARKRGGSRPRHRRPTAARRAAGAPARGEPPANAEAERVVKFGRTDDTSTGSSRVKELYEQLANAKKQVGEEPVSFERVQALVRAQVDKFGADGNVAFKIGMKDGKVSLTVKSEKDKE